MTNQDRESDMMQTSTMPRNAGAHDGRAGKSVVAACSVLLCAVVLALTGCAVPQVTSPEGFANTLQQYRTLGCDTLATLNRNFSSAFDNSSDAALKLYWQSHVAAVKQVQTEKKCDVGPVRPVMGVQLEPVSPALAQSLKLASTEGALIKEVLKGMPAERAGLLAADVILGINGQKLATPAEVAAAVAQLAADAKVEVLIWRNAHQEIVWVDFAPASAKAAPVSSAVMDAATADFDAGRYVDAARKYQQILKQTPRDALVWYFYGQTMEKLRDVVGAQDAYRRVLEITPDGQVADYARQALENLSPKGKKASKKK